MDITFYSTHCPKCKVLEMKMQKKGINYIENNSIDDMEAIGLKSVPALSIDGNLLLFAEAVKWVNDYKEE